MRLVICDSHRLFADTLGIVMRNHGHQVAACTFTPDDGASAVAANRPHLFITELDFPDGDAGAVLAATHESSPMTSIVVLSGSKTPGAAIRAKQAGADAFLSKRRPLADILARMDDVVAGIGVFFDGLSGDNGARQFPTTDPADAFCFLTTREREVLDRLVQGQDTATLARDMGVRYSTARTHIQNLLCKLGVHSKLEAVAVATTLLPQPSPWSHGRPMSNAG
ncbi:MAG TPA: response regulator transcription factor [Acidimicrobiales bacterium]|nr:response regulator transcription factor [Acidimicrobiales bacterium]